MQWYAETLTIDTHGKGLYSFTTQVDALIRNSGVQEGMCYLFCPHTSASLLISEDYDPTTKADLEGFLERLAPDHHAWYRHNFEGPDDASSHVRTMLTPVSLAIPIDAGRLTLGTWQGIFLFEHRVHGHKRQVLVRCLDVHA